MHRAYRLILAIVLQLVVGCATADAGPDPNDPRFREWNVYHGDAGGSQYSSLTQIDRSNVARLEVAWTFSTGDLTERLSQIQCNPIVVEAVLYCTSPQVQLFALRADTGEPIWTYDAFARMPDAGGRHVNRGVVYWSDGGEDRRIFLVASWYLHAVDARTGEPIRGFGTDGMVDLRQGLGRDVSDLFVSATSPGILYGDLLIQGTRVSETLPSAPGHIRAFDVRTGEIVWMFHTIPQPGEFGYDTWPPEAYQYVGGANNWAGMTLDEQRGIVYVPTGSATFDFYGGNRIGENVFANSLIALDAATGQRIWHYQLVRHDLFDYDIPAPPDLVRIRRGGRVIDAVAQVTKTGHIFVFDRDTGEPVFPIREVDAPASPLPGEQAWPRQPVPELPAPFARQNFTEDLITDLSPEAHAAVLERFRQLRGREIFAPPSVEGTVVMPGFNGGAEWGGAAVDPTTGVIYVNSTEMAWVLNMVGVPAPQADPTTRGPRAYLLNCASCHGEDLQGDPQGNFPALSTVGSRMSRDELLAIVNGGRGFMPGFAHLDAGEKEALLTFLIDPASRSGPRAAADVLEPANAQAVSYAHTGWFRFLDPEGYPAVKPPWGTLNAIDLNTGEYLWRVPLGEFPELKARGVPPTGTENYGGPLVTAGGLLFIAATPDKKFRAYDKDTGEVLWEADLPAAGYATPSTYEVNGRQYVVIAAGGGKVGAPSGDTYVAFALPR